MRSPGGGRNKPRPAAVGYAGVVLKQKGVRAGAVKESPPRLQDDCKVPFPSPNPLSSGDGLGG